MLARIDGAADPTWTATNIDTTAQGASQLFVADIDSDGDLLMREVTDATGSKEMAAYAKQIYQAVLPHFGAQDADQEIKKMAKYYHKRVQKGP